MAQDDRFDLARLERRLQALEDAEAIRNLKARYAALCGRQYDADGIAMLFTEDALWESPGFGRFEGREINDDVEFTGGSVSARVSDQALGEAGELRGGLWAVLTRHFIKLYNDPGNDHVDC